MSLFTIKSVEWSLDKNQFSVSVNSHSFGAFIETVTFPKSAQLSDIDPDLRERLGVLCAMMIATSYYKAAPALQIRCEFALTHSARHLAELAFGPGLGEFYVRNELPYPPEFKILAPITNDNASPERPKSVQNLDAVVAFGGGKDSHVASAIVAASGASSERVSVILAEQVGARLRTMSESDVITITRKIDPRLIDLSRQGQALNGHIPITAINSCLLGLYAAARGLDWVVFANERAASEATMQINGHPVNHQFSKSYVFEEALRTAFTACGAPFEYFSILRPVSELWTAHYLVNQASFALDIFASCNRNFVFAGPSVLKHGQRWCGTCAKCVYTAVLLAPFMDVDQHKCVFGCHVLNNPDNLEFLREIAGLTDAKPWECVGERREVACALMHLSRCEDWRNVALIAQIQDELLAVWDKDDLETAWSESLNVRSDHFMPPQITQIVDTPIPKVGIIDV